MFQEVAGSAGNDIARYLNFGTQYAADGIIAYRLEFQGKYIEFTVASGVSLLGDKINIAASHLINVYAQSGLQINYMSQTTYFCKRCGLVLFVVYLSNVTQIFSVRQLLCVCVCVCMCDT